MCQTLLNLMPCCINTHQSPSSTKVPGFGMCRSIISVSKIAYQMCCNRPFSQKNKTTERVVRVGVGGDRGGGGLD